MENSNLKIYNKLKTPPKEALKPIRAGRLKGKTDISPQWRIKAMTDEFGICGIGWKYEITKQWIEPGSNEQLFAFTNINLYVKVDGEWSDAIPANGGSMLVIEEKNGLYSNDEAYKMALTDALGTAMKALGLAADVYMGLLENGASDSTKYDKPTTNSTPAVEKILTGEEVEKKWNGKIYGKDNVFIDNVKYKVNAEQLKKLKDHKKYKPETKK